MSDLVWLGVSVVAITMLFVVLVVSAVPVPLVVASGLFFVAGVVSLLQIGRG